MRNVTNKILEMIDEGLLDARTVASACLKYMSEDDVEEMASMNEFLEDDEEEPEDEEEPTEPHDYILNAGLSTDNLEPYYAFPTKEEAILFAKSALEFWSFTEVVYMPEDNDDINEVVWRSWED